MLAAAAFVGVTGNNNRAYTLGDRRAEVRPLYTPYKARGHSSATGQARSTAENLLGIPQQVFLPRDASAERGDATVSRPSVCPSVCLSVCLSVTIRYRDHIHWNSSKIISWPNSLLSMTPNIGDLVQREHPQN